MVESDFMFNVIIYALVIAYILYINFAAHLNKNTGFLNSLINLFQNWIFRLIFLLIVGFFALDMFPYGGFILAILLTIAFLNTNMLSYKKNFTEKFAVLQGSEIQGASDLEDYEMQQGQNDGENYIEDTNPGAPIDNFSNSEDVEPMKNNSSSKSQMLAKDCGPYAPLQRLPFNPQGYADDSIVSTGYDDLPMDSVSRGDWTDSSIGYKFGRA